MQITITGNYGNSVLAYYLADELAREGKRAVMLCTEQNAPSFPFLLPAEKTEEVKSVGRILAGAVIDAPAVLRNTLSNPINKDMAILSYAPGETANTYPVIVRKSLEDLLSVLSGLVDYIVTVAQTQPNNIDRFFLERSDLQLCVTSADLKGLAWRQSHPESAERATHLLCALGKGEPTEDITRTFQTPLKYQLPYCKEFTGLYSGALLTGISAPPKYTAVLKRLRRDTGLMEKPSIRLRERWKELFPGKEKKISE